MVKVVLKEMMKWCMSMKRFVHTSGRPAGPVESIFFVNYGRSGRKFEKIIFVCFLTMLLLLK